MAIYHQHPTTALQSLTHLTFVSTPQARLFMCYVATHPEKLDESRADQWRKVTRLTPEQFSTITNLEFLGVLVFKRARAGSMLGFGRKPKRNVRKVNTASLCL